MKFKFDILKYNFYFELTKKKSVKNQLNSDIAKLPKPYKLNFGPGYNWKKPDSTWLTVDIDPTLGDIIVDFQQFNGIPIENQSVECVYGSHVFEHISIFKSQLVFDEIYRVLQHGGILRVILPDVVKSMQEYLNNNHDFELFKRRTERQHDNKNSNYTLFECMREDFVSKNGQINLLGHDTLAHQNAWDFDTLKAHLVKSGFKAENIKKMNFQKSQSPYFSFEGTYKSEANEDYRSLYVEAIK